MLVKKRSNPAKYIARSVIPLVVIFAVGYIIFFTPILQIQAVEINGVGASADEINKYLGKDTAGSNILFWKPERMVMEGEHDITKKLATFQIRKSYFERKIIVNMSERDRKLIWCYDVTDSCFWVDEDGVLFEEAPKTSGNLIHSVTEEKAKPAEVGARVIDENLWINLNRIMAITDELNIPVKNANIEDVKFRELIVNTVNGPKIIFGLNIDPDFTKTALASLRENKVSWEKTATVNLTVHGRAYTSF